MKEVGLLNQKESTGVVSPLFSLVVCLLVLKKRMNGLGG